MRFYINLTYIFLKYKDRKHVHFFSMFRKPAQCFNQTLHDRWGIKSATGALDREIKISNSLAKLWKMGSF